MDDPLATLEEYCGRQAETVPTAIATPDAHYEFSASALPPPPAQLTTGRLYIGRGTSTYDEYVTVDKVIFHAHKETFRQLALLILAVVFHPEREAVRLRLTHPASTLKALRITCEGQPFSRWDILRTQAISFLYSPAGARRWPWYDLPLSPAELPCFYLRSDPLGRLDPLAPDAPTVCSAAPQREPNKPDMVAGFGSDQGCVRLAELLLNLGRPESAENDVRLEAEAGWRGVGRKSVEARFVLPGNYLWDPTQWSPAP